MLEFEQVTTRGGDGGETSLYNGERHVKSERLFEVLGDGDELSSFLGLSKLHSNEESLFQIADSLERIQQKLIALGAMVATPLNDPLYKTIPQIEGQDIDTLETWEAELLKDTQIEPVFILPGTTLASSHLDVSRSVCRRLERNLVGLIRETGASHLAVAQRYVNRLSDYLFVCGRAAEQR